MLAFLLTWVRPSRVVVRRGVFACFLGCARVLRGALSGRCVCTRVDVVAILFFDPPPPDVLRRDKVIKRGAHVYGLDCA